MKNISAILFIAALALVSCKSNSVDNNPNNALASPKTGSFFVFDNYDIDTLGNKIVGNPNQPESIDTTTVLATGIQYEGRTNVTNFYFSGLQKGSRFINYDASGDISIFTPQDIRGGFKTRSGWGTIPIASLGSTTFLIVDSVIRENGKADHRLYETETDTYIGNENITVGTETLNCVKIQDVFVRDEEQGSYISHNSDTTIVWFSKKTGYIARVEPPTKVISIKNGNVERGVSILLSYSLKN